MRLIIEGFLIPSLPNSDLGALEPGPGLGAGAVAVPVVAAAEAAASWSRTEELRSDETEKKS